MHKLLAFSAFGVAVAGIAFSAVTPSAAAVCLNPYAGVIPLTHDDMVAGAGFGYDKEFIDEQLAKGNRCSVWKRASTSDQSPANQYNRRPDKHMTNGHYN